MATKNFRYGHRERVRDRFLREGLAAFADYEVLELLLFYAIPRRDTKQQAHALCDALGSLYGALTASAASLCAVSGIGERTANFLRSLYPFLSYVAKEEPHAAPCSGDKSLAFRIYPYIEKTVEETSSLILLNNCDEVICTLPLGKGKGLTLIGTEDIVSHAYAYRASSVLIADYKEEGIPFPDSIILQGVHGLHEELLSVGVHLRDYLLFTKTQYNSLFSLTGEKRLEMPSPFFIEVDVSHERYAPRSAEALSEMLSYVANAERAKELSLSLLTKYGSLSTVFAVPHTTLAFENEEASTEIFYLKLLSELYSRIGLSRIRTAKERYENAHDLGKMFCELIGMNSEETVALAMFDKEMRLLDVTHCAKGSVNTATFVLRSLIETALSHRAAFVAVAHNHPGGTTTPSTPDYAMMSEMFRGFHQAKLGFVDHFVVTRSEAAPISRRGFENYTDMPKSFYD